MKQLLIKLSIWKYKIRMRFFKPKYQSPKHDYIYEQDE